MILAPWQWALAVGCGFINGVAKTGVPGLGILVVPLMLYVVADPRLSPGAVLPMLCAADLFAVLYYRRHAHWERILRFSPWVALGLGCGMLALWAFERGQVDDTVLTRVIGAIVLAMIAMHVARKRAGDAVVPHSEARAALYGIVAGFATTVANAAGPIMNLYLLSMALPKNEFMGTGAWFFCIINLVKIPLFVAQHRITADTLLLDAWLLPAVVLGALSGRRLFARVPQQAFEWIVLAFATVATATLFIPHQPDPQPVAAGTPVVTPLAPTR